jgi:hypothetical protein
MSKKPFLYIYSFLFLSVLISDYVLSEYVDPASIRVQTEKYVPQTDSFRKGVYEYEVSWQGIPVASATIDIRDREIDSSRAYFVEANARTNKVIGVFYKLRHTSDSLFYQKDFRPIRFSLQQTENSRKKSSEIVFGEDGEIRSVLEKNGKVEEARQFFSDNQTLDPISAAFLARSIPIEVGQRASFDVYNAKNRYLISFKVVAVEDLSLPGQAQKRKAYKVIPTLRKLTDTEGEKRFRKAEIWIAADDTRDVLKIESEVFVGSVSAYMKSFTEYDEGGGSTDKVKTGLKVASAQGK